ncbi:putative Peptidase A22A, presenilin [Monocercomonoides exilis]|uniref:putative Peptidase A22A, presenilin n=1 Tax=Monocercomonoides exilis TaxID=2049356 RepID=UPI00355A84D2|nr:putative Peptidase A22A, presenilin [Monocercomonoides exilis]
MKENELERQFIVEGANAVLENNFSNVEEESKTQNNYPNSVSTERPKKRRKRRRHFDSEGDVEIHAGTLASIIVPVSITLIGVIFVILSIGTNGESYISLFITPSSSPPDGYCIPFGPKATGKPPPPEDEEKNKKIIIISIIVAAVFVVMMVAVTFFILCCYMKGFTKFIYGWLVIATVILLGLFGGTIMYNLVIRYSIPIDWFTFFFFCLNFSVAGVISVYITSPLSIQQGILVFISIFMAWALTNLPEWTTWILLVLVAVYDLFAVLCPCCALNKLIEIADERNEPIPGLIYTAEMGEERKERIRGEGKTEKKKKKKEEKGKEQKNNKNDQKEIEPGQEETQPLLSSIGMRDIGNENEGVEERGKGKERESIVTENAKEKNKAVEAKKETRREKKNDKMKRTEQEDIMKEKTSKSGAFQREEKQKESERNSNNEAKLSEKTQRGSSEKREGDDEDATYMDGTLSLGLGDFIFYSLLVSRAVLTDWNTTFACYFSILFGLSMTVVLLALWRNALPALPISIFTGTAIYFVSRFLIHPFSCNQVYLGLTL